MPSDEKQGPCRVGDWHQKEACRATVHIVRGQHVILDVSPPPLGLLLIEGSLRVDSAPVALELRATNIVVRGGTLAAGSATAPHLRELNITLLGTPTSHQIGTYGAQSLVCDDCELELWGRGGYSTWASLAVTMNPGDSIATFVGGMSSISPLVGTVVGLDSTLGSATQGRITFDRSPYHKLECVPVTDGERTYFVMSADWDESPLAANVYEAADTTCAGDRRGKPMVRHEFEVGDDIYQLWPLGSKLIIGNTHPSAEQNLGEPELSVLGLGAPCRDSTSSFPASPSPVSKSQAGK